MKSYSVTLESVTPYMQHRMDDGKLKENESKTSKTVGRAEVGDEDEVRAESFCYRDKETGKCYIPSMHIRGSLIGAGSMSKAKVGTRSKSMKTIVAAMFFINPEKIFIPNFDEVDIQSAVNQKVKARIIVIRPKWNSWKATFTLIVDEDAITLATIKEIITNAGSYVGIGSYRPTNNGSYGRYKLVEIKEISPAK